MGQDEVQVKWIYNQFGYLFFSSPNEIVRVTVKDYCIFLLIIIIIIVILQLFPNFCTNYKKHLKTQKMKVL